MFLIIVLVVMAAFAAVGYNMAESRNKDPFLWAILCGLTGLIGVLILAATGEAKRPEQDYVRLPRDTNPLPENAAGVRTGEPLKKTLAFDEKKWAALKEVDPEISAASAEVTALGTAYDAELAEKFLVLGDKSYLPAIVQRIKETAAQVAEETRAISQAASTMLSEKAAQAYQSYMARLQETGGLDPSTSQKVIRVEEFTGPIATGWHGGLRILMDDGTTLIREGSRARSFKSEQEADEWGGKQEVRQVG